MRLVLILITKPRAVLLISQLHMLVFGKVTFGHDTFLATLRPPTAEFTNAMDIEVLLTAEPLHARVASPGSKKAHEKLVLPVTPAARTEVPRE